MKKVLIITYHFPPDAAIGAVRPAKFAKYLPDFGWEPIIYTVNEKNYESCDDSKFEPILKDLTIYRANLLPGLMQLYSRFIHGRIKPSGNTSNITQSHERGSENKVNSLRRVFRSLVLIPDANQGWIFNILFDGYKIIRDRKVDAIVTSGPPMSTHLGGLLLKYLTHVKWVADFRDPWKSPARSTVWKSGYVSSAGDYIGDWLESRVVSAADRVVTTAGSLNSHLRSILPEAHRNKCHIITNGFDESDFSGLNTSTAEKNSKILITYAGSLYFNRDPEPLFVTLSDLFKRGDLEKKSIEIDLVGECGNWRGIPIQGLIDKYDLGSVIHVIGRVPFRESLEKMAQSDALLLFAQGQSWSIPGKVYDYLKLCKPIFAMIDEGDTKDLLQSFRNVFIADPNNSETMRQSFLGMIESLSDGAGGPDLEDQIKRFDRRTLTESLAWCLEQKSV
jgi:hypothetical protein